MRKNKIEILLFSLLILLSVFLLNFLSGNNIAHNISSYFTKISYPFFSLRNFLNNFVKNEKITYKITLFDENIDELVPLSYTVNGIYFYKIDSPGIIITTDKKFVGIAGYSGKFVFVKKWWYDTIEVTIVTDDFETEAIINKGELIVDDNVSIKSGKIFLSKYLPYSYLLFKEGIILGEIKNGIFIKNIPSLNLKTKFVLLKNYLEE
ncbi:MAG: hypothetical protein PWP54_192 [Thermosipho sp. (in: thermotogales)]|nr:hypothetical protein [Thermosipho sp. (in: thermotogales)]MDN5324533.1 hypothetical protein [Thermosipho sp. (in: thermotogales)]